jgi:hypothetical protein
VSSVSTFSVAGKDYKKRTKTSWSYRRLKKNWGQWYRQMQHEIEMGDIKHRTLYASYQFVTDKRHRMWLHAKWQKAILEKEGLTPLGFYLLNLNSYRAFKKVMYRHWWDAQMSGKQCQCHRCVALGLTQPVAHVMESDEYKVGEFIYDRVQPLKDVTIAI